MRKTALLFLLCLVAGQQALAGDSSSEKKAEGTLEKVGKKAGNGVERGAEAAGRGIKKGGRAAGHGIEKAADWVQRKLDKGGGKKEDKPEEKKGGAD